MEYILDENAGILHVRPAGPLREEDFAALTRAADGYISREGELAGLIVETRRFPGWEDLAAALGHFRFVKDHHAKIRKVALVTESPLGSIGQHLASLFVSAEIRKFDMDELAAARDWIATG